MSRFFSLIVTLSKALGNRAHDAAGFRYGVGGLLPDPDCAYTGITDGSFVLNGRYKFVTEAKTTAAYSVREPWYRKSQVPIVQRRACGRRQISFVDIEQLRFRV